MSSKKSNTIIYIIAFCFFAAATGYLCVAGFAENSVYFLNVSEARAASSDKLKQARLFGVVSQAGLNQQINAVNFNLADKDDQALIIPVIYKGAVPDTFKTGSEVIVEGSMQPDGQFRASTLMTKCPSKYKKENRES